MPELSLFQAVVNGGPALIILLGLVMIWRVWRKDRTKADADRDELLRCLKKAQEDRVDDAERWAERFSELAERTERTVAEMAKIVELAQRLAGGQG